MFSFFIFISEMNKTRLLSGLILTSEFNKQKKIETNHDRS
jgi:hypothetical protein